MYQFPQCRKCDDGDLVPLSDFGSQGAPIHYKAWVCTNPDCGYNIKIRNGDLFIDEPINDGQVTRSAAAREAASAAAPRALYAGTLRHALCGRLPTRWHRRTRSTSRSRSTLETRRRRGTPAEHPRHQRRPGPQLGAPLVALALHVRARLLRHGDDRHRQPRATTSRASAPRSSAPPRGRPTS